MPNVRTITHDGVSRSLKEWAEKTGIPASTIVSRINAGWPLGEALTAPVDRRFRRGGRRPANAPRPCPALKEHATGQAVARWWQDGKEHARYFGPWGSAEAAAAYRRFQVEWAAGVAAAGPAGESVSVGGLVKRWLAHCERTYVKHGRITSEVHCQRAAMRHLVELYGDTPAVEFDARRLRAVREAMVGEDWYRKTVNDHVARVVRAFGWAVTEGIVPEPVHKLLALVEPLVQGRTAAPEGKPRAPVPAGDIGAILSHLHPKPNRRAVLVAMVQVQRLTGMRPGELCSVRPEDIDRSATPWRYEVTAFNKMLHKDVNRVVFIGPKAREILAPFLAAAEPGRPIFRFPPWRSKADWSPISVVRYRNRIRLACKAAGVARWVPHQLRHNKATDVMDRYESDEAAGRAIGDTPEVARQVYAHRAGEAVARRIAEETG